VQFKFKEPYLVAA